MKATKTKEENKMTYPRGKENIPYLRGMEEMLKIRIQHFAGIEERYSKSLISEDTFRTMKTEYFAEINILERLITAYRQLHERGA